MPQFIIPGGASGLLVRGNIDLEIRKLPLIHNKDGTISSVRSSCWTFHQGDDTGRIRIPPNVRNRPKGFGLAIPDVISQGGKWKVVSSKQALNHALSTGRHLGVFDDTHHACQYTVALHNYLATFVKKL